MPVFRSYFSKNATLISNNATNNSLNPVTEISYGTEDKKVSRYIFDIDLSKLKSYTDSGIISKNNVISHKLKITNTISNFEKYIGKKSYSDTIQRASSFSLDLFNVNQDWNEGSGYDFIYDPIKNVTLTGATNWFLAKTTTPWSNQGAYLSGSTTIIGNQSFDKGNENIDIDVTDYINSLIFTGTTGFTGTTYGLGLKFNDQFENLSTKFRQAVAFFGKNTNTFYEPYIETTYDNIIYDDRNYFFLNKLNNLFLFVKNAKSIVVNSVDIYDYEGKLFTTLTGSTITEVVPGTFKISLEIDSDQYPDAVIFNDTWNVIIDGKSKQIEQDFYLISDENYYFSNNLNLKNYSITLSGLDNNESIRTGEIRNIIINIKELYSTQSLLPLDFEYRVFITVGENHQIDVIPFTQVNRIKNHYVIPFDGSWMIPQDYFLEIKMKSENLTKIMCKQKFKVVNDRLI